MAGSTFVKELSPYVELHKDVKTGIAWVTDGKTGMGHSAHPNIDSSGSVKGMKKQGYWHKDAVTVTSHGCLYNISSCVVSDAYDEFARQNCTCGGNHKIK